jgi:hypothetical protein
MVYLQKNIDQTYIYLLESSFVTIDTFETDLAILRDFFERISAVKPIFKAYNKTECKQVLASIKKYTPFDRKEVEIPHTGLPLPDPEKGRPHLGWCVCKHKGCNKRFPSGIELVNHLIKCGVYTHGFHEFHELIVKNTLLTPDKIIEKNITVCPSYACNSKRFDTPQDLNNHFRELGISPFWKKGDVIKGDDTALISLTSPKKIHTNDECVICILEKPMFLTNNCRHHPYCIKCIQHVKDKRCPYCKTNVNFYIPFLWQTISTDCKEDHLDV